MSCDQLAALGTREISLIGGEAYPAPRLARRSSGRSRTPGSTARSRPAVAALTCEKIEAAAAAGVGTLGVSVDGPSEVHDRLRGVQGQLRPGDRAR